MAVSLNHTIAHAHDARAAAELLCELLGLEAPGRWGPFHTVKLANEAELDYMDAGEGNEMQGQHYSFLVSEEEFDQIWDRIKARDIPFYADPAGHERGQIYELWGGRGLYWSDPSGNWMEIQTVPYGELGG